MRVLRLWAGAPTQRGPPGRFCVSAPGPDAGSTKFRLTLTTPSGARDLVCDQSDSSMPPLEAARHSNPLEFSNWCYDLGNISLVNLRYATRDLEKACSSARRMQAAFGANVAKKLKLRIAELMYVEEMADLLSGPGRWEELKGNRADQWSARLTGNWRLIVQPEEGDKMTVLVVEIIDYH